MPYLAFLAVLSLGCTPDTGINTIYPEMAVFPDALDFGEVVVDDGQVSLPVTITNAGRSPLDLTELSLLDGGQGYSLGLPDVTELLTDERVDVSVYFEPPNYLSYEDTLVIQTNDPDFESGLLVPIVGTGVDAPRPAICVDPQSLDYGFVDPGVVDIQWFEVENCGDAPLTITGDQQTGSGAFELASSSPVGNVLDVGARLTINFLYDPNNSDGDSGTYTLSSDDPDTPELDIKLIGNGGGGNDYPVALIDPCSAQVAPLDIIHMDGTGSTDPDGLDLSYTWILADQPDGSQTSLEGETTDSARLFIDVAGDYTVQLVVENEIGIKSAPYTCRMEAIPEDAVHVELTWNTSNTDLDLHLLNGADAAFYDEPYDVCWCAPQGNWGDSSTDIDDAFLDIDDLIGFGPENVNIHQPVDGSYYIRVHYFEDGGDGSTTATVRIYINGFLERELERVLDRNDVWDVAYIEWDASPVVVEEDAELYVAPARACY